MKRVYLQKITQYGTVSYIGKIDPRVLIRVAKKVEMSATQDAQRPLNEKRVKSIAKYVSEESGILPNTLTLATSDSRFSIKKCEDIHDMYYMDFPSESDEFNAYVESIDVMDGQHRLYSFASDIRLLSEDTDYEIGFTIYEKPTLSEKRKIFISCNEKQEKVSGNLLMWFRAQLNMLTTDEKEFYNLVSMLSKEYPLKGHIIMSAEKIKNGVKSKEVIAAIKQAGIQDLMAGSNYLTDDDKVKVICTYLSAWEKVVDFSFTQSNAKTAGAAIKMAGLKYMLLLLPAFWERAIASKSKFNSAYIEETLKKFISSLGVEREQFFVGEEHKMCFRDRTAVDLFAKQSVAKIKSLDTDDFNPLGF